MTRRSFRNWLLAVGVVGLAATQAVSLQAQYPSPADWRDEVLYQVITDRFEDGDPSNNTLSTQYSPAVGNRTHGGDFAGLTRRLNYVRGMGITGIWISPIPLNGAGEYHGYAAKDFYALAPHWGTLATAQDFVTTAHSHDMKVILDVVTNHGGNLFNDNGYVAPPSTHNLTYRNGANQHAAPFNSTSHWHAHGSIGSFSDPEQILGELFGLDDLKTENADVRTHMVDIFTTWIDRLDVDGFRIDTVKHVELGFWQDWTPRMRTNAAALGKSSFFMFGEVYDGDDYFNGKYTGTQSGGAFALDSTLNYPLHFATNGVFAFANTGAQTIVDHLDRVPLAYDAAARDRLVTFLDNHDNPRFLSSSYANNRTERLHSALAFQLTWTGVPCIYYGTEQYFNGGNDPFCREDMFDGQWEFGPSLGNNFDQTAPAYRLIRKLNQFRRDHEALRRGTTTIRQVSGSPGTFAFSRLHAGNEVLVAINTSDTTGTGSNWLTTHAQGTVLEDLVNPGYTVTINASNRVPTGTPMPANGFRIFVPQGQVTNVEPEVVAVNVGVGEKLPSAVTSVTLTFSEPMSTPTVNAGFAILPATAGTLSWDVSGTQLTFTPDSSWVEDQHYRLLVAESAADTGGALLTGGFETEFLGGETPPEPDFGIDGTIAGDPRWGGSVTVQTVNTQFGNNTLNGPDNNSGGSEANELFLASDSDWLYMAVGGNLEPNGNSLIIFLDTDGTTGGVSTLGGSGASTPFLSGANSAAGTVLPSCMHADLLLQVQAFGPGQQLRLNAYKWNAGGNLVFEGLVGAIPASLGEPTKGSISGIIDGTSHTLRLALDNSHTGPVGSGTGTASPNGAGAATGIEIAVPRTLIGAGPYNLFVGISGSTGFWANQFLPPISPQGNLGWSPNLGTAGCSCIPYTPIPVAVSLFSAE